MDDRVVELVEKTKNKFGLNHYHLHTYAIERTVNIVNETRYILTMEWFPDHEFPVTDDDLNPDGTAVIDMDIHSHQYRSVVFVNDTTFADIVKWDIHDKQNMIEWLEQETGLVYDEHFTHDQLAPEANRFKASYGQIAVYPSGTLEIKTDTNGNLTQFANFGYFPNPEMIQKETYNLAMSDTEHIAKEQIQLIDWPIYEQEQLVPIYAIEEVFITNKQYSIIPFDVTEQPDIYIQVDKVMAWDSPFEQDFHVQEISITEDIDLDTAFEKEPSPEVNPIPKFDYEKSIKNVRRFLSQIYPEDTEEWTLKTLHREHNYIHATLRKTKHTKRKSVIQNKLVVILDGDDLEVLTYIDNEPMVTMLTEFKASDVINLTREEAYDKLKTHLELTPYYVYDVNQKQYILCGKLECQYAVDAENGQLVELEELT